MAVDTPVSPPIFPLALRGSVARARTVRSAEQWVASTIQRLLSQHHAVAVTHWIRKDDGSLTDVALGGEMTSEIRHKAAALAAQVVADSEVSSQILSSRHHQFLVGSPLPCVAGEALTVLFRQPASGDLSEICESRKREVSLAAAHLSLLMAHAPAHRGQTPPDQLPEQPICEDSSQPHRTARSARLYQRLRALVAENKHHSKWHAAMIAGLLLIGLIPWQHSVTCDVICEPAQRRFVAAPFDGKLLKSYVAPGDEVEEDQILAVLDGGDLNSQLASLHAKRDQSLQRRSAALSSGDGSKAELERLEVQHLQSEIDLLQKRQHNLEIRSPITGVVVSGDMERAEGVPLQVGRTLFEIAPLDQLVAEIAIPETDVSHVASGMTINIKLDAIAGSRYSAQLARIHPRNEIRDNASVFIAEAFLANEDLAMRPGMNGTASIQAGFRPLGWLLFHRPYEALRGLIGW